MAQWHPDILRFFKRQFPAVNFIDPVQDERLWPAAYVVAFGINELATHLNFEVDIGYAGPDLDMFKPRVRASTLRGSETCVALLEDFLADHQKVGDLILSGKWRLSPAPSKKDHSDAIKELLLILDRVKKEPTIPQKRPLTQSERERLLSMFDVQEISPVRDVQTWLKGWEVEPVDFRDILTRKTD